MSTSYCLFGEFLQVQDVLTESLISYMGINENFDT